MKKSIGTVIMCCLFLITQPFATCYETQISPLTFRVIDAEFSKQLNRIIMVSSNANQLHIHNPITGEETGAVSLPLTPNCVSISPDGYYAAVGHNGWVSYINLVTGQLLKALATTTDVLDVVLTGNGYVYVFPRRDQWEMIRCINIATGVETLSTGNNIYAGTLAKLHPSGKYIYGADNGLSPSDIEKYDIQNGTAAFMYDSPYHGDFAMCGNLWMSEDGLRIFTKCGSVFRSSEVRAEDMTYNGFLSETGSVQWISHSQQQNKVAVIPANTYSISNADTVIQFYNYNYLAFETKADLPSFQVNGKLYSSHGKYVFFSPDGANCYVIVMADPASGMLYDYGVATYSVTNTGFSAIPSFNIKLDNSVYTNGGTVRVTEFRLSNMGANATEVELGVWLTIPGYPAISIFNLGADHSLILPAGLNTDFAPLDLLTVTSSFPRGAYEFSSRMVNPTTKNMLSQSLNNFVIN